MTGRFYLYIMLAVLVMGVTTMVTVWPSGSVNIRGNVPVYRLIDTSIESGGATSTSCQLFKGAFVVINSKWVHRSLSPQEWQFELNRMNQIGIEDIIVQQTVNIYDGRILASYPSSFIREHEYDTDQIRYLLDAADEKRMKVYLGLIKKPLWFEQDKKTVWAWDWPWWWHHKNIADELVELYGDHPSFVGFYISQEPTVNYAGNPNHNLAVKYFSILSERLKERHPHKELLVAPTYIAKSSKCSDYENLSVSANEFEYLLDGFLGRTHFDKILLQDKIGVDLVSQQDLPFYLQAAARASEKNRVSFGVTVETFQYCNGCSRFCPANSSRVLIQQKAARQVTSDMYVYSWFEDFSGTGLYDQLLDSCSSLGEGSRLQD